MSLGYCKFLNSLINSSLYGEDSRGEARESQRRLRNGERRRGKRGEVRLEVYRFLVLYFTS